MKTFLSEVVENILSEHGNISDIIFVLPGKRAGVFLKREIRRRMTQTAFAPQVYSVEEFVQELSGLRLIPNIQLLFEFYGAYQKATPREQQEDFYSFSKWAQMMLQDFNEIDRYLIPPDRIFSHLSSIKELDHWYLSEKKTPLQEQYIQFWKTLDRYYHLLKAELLSAQCGYQGLIYREAIKNIEHYLSHKEGRKHVFIGFNALNNAESAMIQEFLAAGAEVYWDTDKVFMDDPEHDAGLFMRRYRKAWKHYRDNPFKNINTHFSAPKNIEIIGVPGKTGQAMYVHSILSSLKSNGSIAQAAVVLGNEELLNPILNAIPDDIPDVNITGGFPLAYTPMASWFHAFFQLLENETSGKWYYQHVLNLVSHPVSKTLLTHNGRDLASAFIRTIQDNNIVFITREHLEKAFEHMISDTKNGNSVTELLFFSKDTCTVNDIIKKCTDLTLRMKDIYSGKGNQVFLEYLYRFYEIFNQIRFFNEKYHVISIHALTGIYRELLLQETVDFQGEPLEGLQVMGVLESRNLDYETVIITSVNEGDLPSGKSGNSFIPFDIKVAYGLPTYKEKDAIYAYHFYRLLQRAKNVYLLYNTDSGTFDGGEKSRFIQQLTTFRQENHHIRERIAAPRAENLPGPPSPVKKTPALMEAIRELAQAGFSPTSLTNYIRDPLAFYHQTILHIRDEYEVEETIAANTLGTIIHDTLEDLYKPLTGKVLTLAHIEDMQNRANDIVNLKFGQVYRGGDFSRGKNLLSYEVAKQYLKNFLKTEEKRIREGNSIKIVEIESNLKVKVEVPGIPYPVYLKGKVDRVEEINGTLCFIDYKTGKVEQGDVELAQWEDLIADYKYSKAFQLLCYSYMLTRNSPYTLPAEAAIISFKNLQKGFLKFAKKGESRHDKDNAITEETFQYFSEQLHRLISEICNPDMPFTEKEGP
ncbi:PD-(D/E)XK nuclease family protein [Sinomicrobium weinanense]|uniref:PD-(D/E)XK nuclease family protein n=1 Tax=Sinomicrobium weinanense TaxID=2842200 RepID=A0A926Q006_9FLAO|nr:PD-(D/E)XK nuclease family protein [Sinomicrobium weinanense]MBU3124375.1 PD-(D/E)XK nuclease family protein [Sinomicrobium weinanense]